MSNDSQLNALVRKLLTKVQRQDDQLRDMKAQYQAFVAACEAQPRSITEEIDSIPGRRIFYTMGSRLSFTIANDGLRGEPMPFLVSQDGPFVMTHYPLVVWKPNAPTTATNFGQWSPVSSWPLPTQENTAQDRIDLSYEFQDGGSQRNFQNEAVAPVFSRLDMLAPLPVPTLFAPNTVINFIPTFENIFFASPATPTTGGELVVALPGYRIVNL